MQPPTPIKNVLLKEAIGKANRSTQASKPLDRASGPVQSFEYETEHWTHIRILPRMLKNQTFGSKYGMESPLFLFYGQRWAGNFNSTMFANAKIHQNLLSKVEKLRETFSPRYRCKMEI